MNEKDIEEINEALSKIREIDSELFKKLTELENNINSMSIICANIKETLDKECQHEFTCEAILTGQAFCVLCGYRPNREEEKLWKIL